MFRFIRGGYLEALPSDARGEQLQGGRCAGSAEMVIPQYSVAVLHGCRNCQEQQLYCSPQPSAI